METNLRRRLEARLADISSRLVKLRTDAKPVAQTTHAFFAVAAMIPRTILGIWCTSAFPWGIAVAATVEILKHGDFLYIVQYIRRMRMGHRIKIREKQQVCHRNWLNRYV